MAAVTGTLVELGGSGLAGDGEKLIQITGVPTSASDIITLTEATHGIKSITAILDESITAGFSATFTSITASASGLVITLNSYEADGTAATGWTSAAVRITLLGKV